MVIAQPREQSPYVEWFADNAEDDTLISLELFYTDRMAENEWNTFVAPEFAAVSNTRLLGIRMGSVKGAYTIETQLNYLCKCLAMPTLKG